MKASKISADPIGWWQSQIGAVAPVGYALRAHFCERWTRFHSLAESKRYAESAAEKQELIKRHTEVASALFNPGERLYVYQSRLSESRKQLRCKHEVARRQLRESTMRSRANPDTVATGDDDLFLSRALVTSWKPDFFELLVREVSEEREYMVTIASPDTQNIYCPYDGGMDIFVSSVSPSALGAQFLLWQSERPDKL